MLLRLMLMIFLNTLLLSCKKTKYPWQPGISAPKYYPVAGVRIDFGSAGHGSLTSFDNGWGNEYGGVVSGAKYKEIPKEVHIHYNNGAENYTYEGKVLLPQEKILNLFRENKIDDKNFAHLVVGMAPGGWIRVWFKTINKQIEVAKAQLKGHYDETADERYKVKNFENWGKYYVYWQHHWIPYEAWANNEKEYDLYFDFNKPNEREVGFSYVSEDGTFYQGVAEKCHQKLPAQIEQIAWLDTSGNSYNCKVPMPKSFKNYIQQKNLKKVNLKLEIENDQQHCILYLIINGEKQKLIRFKNKKPTDQERKDIEYDYAQEIEYFIP